ncbi:hypothetical protein [Methanosarcina sp.]|uniref:hypothetical protein n=1 Tax=Methanosarcina sp. TaxID=2213 RepID=UPI003BB751A7
MSTYKPETVAAFKRIYAERESTIEYIMKFGSANDKVLARQIKEVALGVSC